MARFMEFRCGCRSLILATAWAVSLMASGGAFGQSHRPQSAVLDNNCNTTADPAQDPWTPSVANCTTCSSTNGDPVTVCSAGSSIEVFYQVMITSNDDWEGINWNIETQAEMCADTTDRPSNGTFTERFCITVPALAPGFYDLRLNAEGDTGAGSNACADQLTGEMTLTNAIYVCCPTATSETVCNGVDDDCDRMVDEDATQCCGNDEVEGDEECDGTDDDDCEGECRSDCTCPPPPTGACCDQANDTCAADMTEEECNASDQNRWGGPGSTCDNIDPPCEACQEPCSACSIKTGAGTREVEVFLEDISYDSGSDTTTFSYRLCQAPDSQDLSNWILGLSAECCDRLVEATGGTSADESCQTDPNCALFGHKWETNGGIEVCDAPVCDDEGDLFTITLQGNITATECAKAANKIDGPPACAFGCVLAPKCGCERDDDCPPDPSKCVQSVCDTDTNTCTTSPRPDCCEDDGDCPTDTAKCVDSFCDPSDNMCKTRPRPDCCVDDQDCPPDPSKCVDSFCDPSDNMCKTQGRPDCCEDDEDCPADPSKCVASFCDTSNGTCQTSRRPDCCETDADCPDSTDCVTSFCDLQTNMCATSEIADCRVDASTKGSLLMFSKVELRWGPGGALRQDTVLELTNDYPDDVCVQLYFVNGDEPLDPITDPVTGGVIVEGEPGWVWVDCQICLTPDQPIYWSAATGLPAGCQPFTVLDPNTGSGPGRPDPATPGERHLRGFVYAWAVDQEGHAIKWNHLSGGATLINYFDTDAWDYNAWAFQAHNNCERVCEAMNRCENPRMVCEQVEHGERIGDPGRIKLDGLHYDSGFDMLLMDFFASGAGILSNGVSVVADTDLTLHPITADLRQDSIGPITTKAEFAIWNEDERRFSGTTRCITCWDQTLLSQYNNPNHFLLANLQADKGKARINGVESIVCDLNCVRDEYNHKHGALDIDFILDILGIDHVCSYDASLLGVVAKVLAFPGGPGRIATAGRNLVGMGTEDGFIKWDVIAPPGTALHSADGLRSERKVVKSPSAIRARTPDSAQAIDPSTIPAE